MPGALRELGQLAEQQAGDGRGVKPAQPDGRLGLRVRAPERRIFRGERPGYPLLDQLRHRLLGVRGRPRAAGLCADARRRGGRRAHFRLTSRTELPAPLPAMRAISFLIVASSSFHEAANFSTPSFSSTSVTESYPMPRSSRSAKTCRASSYVPRTVSPRSTAWSAVAWMVASGIVFTVPGATRSTT